MLPRYVVPAILAVIAVFVIVMYVMTPNTGSIRDTPDFADNISAGIPTGTSVEVSDNVTVTINPNETSKPKHYVINVTDAPIIGE